MKLCLILLYIMTHKDTFFTQKRSLNLGGRLMDLTQPKVMGILNLTPDSFYGGSRLADETQILARAEEMLAQGADFLDLGAYSTRDLGAYSTRPGAEEVSAEEEEERLIPAVELLSKTFPQAFLSVDTFRAAVAEKAIGSGAHIINDVSGGTLDKKMFATVGRLGVPYVLMHMRGTPKTMSKLNQYQNLAQELYSYFAEKIQELKSLGVKDLIIDPGFGFAKNIDQNYHLLNHLAHFKSLGHPLLAGLSRKSMIWKTLNCQPSEALNATTALNMVALQHGASILRVHDVKEAKECITIFNKLKNNC